MARPLVAFMGAPAAQSGTVEEMMAQQEAQGRNAALAKALQGGGGGSGKAAPVYNMGQGMAVLAGGAIDGLVARAKVDQEEAGRRGAAQAIGALLGGGAAAPFAGVGPTPTGPSFAPTSSGISPSMAGTPTLPSAGGPGRTTPSAVYDGLVQRGVPSMVAAGMVGNISAESGFRTNIADGRGEGSIGLIQARGDRLTALQNLGAQTGRDPFSLDNQLDHIVNEFKGPEKRAFDIASRAGTSGDAAYALGKYYERPADWALRQSAPHRMGAAEDAYRQYGGQRAEADLPMQGSAEVGLSTNRPGFVVPPAPGGQEGGPPSPLLGNLLEQAGAGVASELAAPQIDEASGPVALPAPLNFGGDEPVGPPMPAFDPAPASSPLLGNSLEGAGNAMSARLASPAIMDLPGTPAPQGPAPAVMPPMGFGDDPRLGAPQAGAPMPLPPARPADMGAPAPSMVGLPPPAMAPQAPGFIQNAPLPPPRPNFAPPADTPAPGAQPVALPPPALAPRDRAIAQALMAPPSSDDSPAAFARSGAMRSLFDGPDPRGISPANQAIASALTGGGASAGPANPVAGVLGRVLTGQSAVPPAPAAPSPAGGPAAPQPSAAQPNAPQPAAGAPVQVAQNGPGLPAGAVPQGAPQAPMGAPVPDADRRALALRVLNNPYASSEMRGFALKALDGPTYSYQNAPDGTMLRLDPHGGAPVPVYRSEQKGEAINGSLVNPYTGRTIAQVPKDADFGVVGKDASGNDILGYRNYGSQSVNVPSVPGNAAGVPPVDMQGRPIPQGVDPRVVREAQSKEYAAGTLPASSQATAELRKEVFQTQAYKNYSQAIPIYKTMTDAAGRNTKAADLNLVYGMAKLYDPGSVVREGEMVMVNNTQGLPDRLVGMINSLNGGAALAPEARSRLMTEAGSRMKAYEGEYGSTMDHYRSIATRNRMNPEDVVQRFEPIQPWAPPQAAAPAMAPPSSAVEMLRGNPTLRDQFDRKYGAGAAARSLGGR